MQDFENDNLEILKQMIATDGVKGAVVLFGAEDFLKNLYAARITDITVPPEARSFDLSEFIGEADTDALRDLSAALPMASPRRLILLRDINLSKLGDDRADSLAETIAALPDECVMLFLFVATEPDMQSAKAKRIFKNALTVELKRSEPAKLRNWAIKLISDRGGNISPRTAERLVALCGNDMYTIKNEAEKLAAFAGDAEITEEMLSRTELPDTELTAFKLADAMAERRFSDALHILRELELQKAQAPDIMGAVFSVFANNYRVAVALAEGKSFSSLSPFYGYAKKQFVLKIAAARARSMPLPYFREAALLCARTDRRIKTVFSDNSAIYELVGELTALSDRYAS